MQFHINDVLVFDDHVMRLSQLTDETKHAKLGSIHSRCLSYICTRAVEQGPEAKDSFIVTWKELFFHGWEKYGLSSSKNGLAQAIFQLRKRLGHLGIVKGITTIPRVGYRFTGFDIRIFNAQQTSDKNNHPEQPVQSNKPLTISSLEALGLPPIHELLNTLCFTSGTSTPLLIIIKS